jgi:DNA-binding CsgD family transcriptional regulator/predicted negative regulator of RcsB-dependent stress response
MALEAALEPLARGEQALRAGDWETARTAFESALEADEDPAAQDGLGRAWWWLGDLDAALAHRERAYVLYRKRDETARAARIALWLSREYLEAVGNEPASNGWVARARGLLQGEETAAERGWLEIALGERAVQPPTIRTHGTAALAIGRAVGEADLEATALAMLGRASVLEGDVEGGLTSLDEAMTAATSGEVDDPLVFGDICCIVTRACEEAGELGRLMRWNEVIVNYLERHHHAPLIQWCGTCGAEVFLAMGDLSTAEQCLVEAIGGLKDTGHRSRCVQPNVKLAELRLLQGRTAEAEALLEGADDVPEATRPTVALHRERGQHAIAAALLLRRLNAVGETVAAIPLLSLLVEVQIDQELLEDASRTLDRLRAIAERSRHPRYLAIHDLAAGRLALASGDAAGARERFEVALATFTGVEARLEAARARFALAAALAAGSPEVATREAGAALEAFERIGASREADEAAALVRRLGGRARTGPKGVGLLSRREAEVLQLVGEGLSNAEIAARLYISTKTAGNHVSNVLSKLGLRNRSEAAAYAIRSRGQPTR